MERRIVFKAKQQVELENFTPDSIGSNQVGVRSYYSLISTGTENIVYNRLFEPETHWDGWVKYPFYPGYAMIGEVISVGKDVQRLKKSDIVAIRRGHASYHNVNEDDCYLIPSAMDLKEASWFALAKIAFLGARAANYSMGENILVIGAGPIGQLTVRWAYALGAERIVSADKFEQRLAYSLKGGASLTITQMIDEAKEVMQEHFSGNYPDIIIDATANPSVLKSALNIIKTQGKIVILGDNGRFSQMQLTKDIVTRGIQLIGTHDGLATGEWGAERIHRAFCNYYSSGRFNLKGLISHEFKPTECHGAYQVSNEALGTTMGILFNWT